MTVLEIRRTTFSERNDGIKGRYYFDRANRYLESFSELSRRPRVFTRVSSRVTRLRVVSI